MYDTLLKLRSTSRAARFTTLGLVMLLALPASAFAQTKPAANQPANAADDGGSESDAEGNEPEPSAEEMAAEEARAEAEAEAELAKEEAAAGETVTRAPPKGKGGVWGTVKDTKFNEGVIDAQVQVLGRKEKVFADLEGRFRFDLPPGTYRIRVTYELHQPSRVDEVQVREGKLTRVEVRLVPDESAVEEVVIEEDVDRTSTEGQNLSRKQSAVAGDGVGRAEIARTPDRNAAEAAQRVVGATIVDGRFVFVRGLGERYTNALLNGAPLPSPEPDRNTVPLDLFPSLVLDSLTIVKQFTPDMPADFAGGSVRIQTREFPKQTLFQISASGGYNTESTFRGRPDYRGSSTDWLGFDGGRRQFPPGIPEDRKLSTSNTREEEQVAYAYRFNTPMSTLRSGTPPNHGINVVAGDGFKLGPDEKLGAMLALSYGRSYQIRELTARRFTKGELPGGSPALIVGDDFKGVQGVDSVRWGAFGSASLELSKQHTLGLIALRSQTADDLTSELEGEFLTSRGATFHTNHLEYVSRSLNFLQTRGEHRFPRTGGLEIDWHVSIATANRDQPDTRDVRYLSAERDGQPGWEFSADGSGLHQYYDQGDTTRAAGLDVLKPLITDPDHETKLKLGGLLTSRDRAFRARRFKIEPVRVPGAFYNIISFCDGASWSTGCPGQLFRQEAILPDGLVVDETTLNLDEYETSLDVYALYGMVDAEVLPSLRAIAGVRAEITYQVFAGFDPFDREATTERSQIYSTDWLPALSLVYAVTSKANTRLGLSKTLARPQLREIAPTLFSSYSGDVSVQGNKNLELTSVTNADLRFELFPTLREVVALSFFYKHFARPIEEIIGSSGIQGFTNADTAKLVGIELEGRKTLDFLGPQLKDFTLLGNLTWVRSQVELGTRRAAATNDHRPLSYQSPYVLNFSLDYGNDESKTNVRALYNVYGPRITAVGSNGLPDVYELPRHQVDLSAAQKIAKHFELKLVAQNILSAPVVFAYRDVLAFKEVPQADGPTRYESLGRNPVLRRYDPGTTVTLTGTYTY